MRMPQDGGARFLIGAFLALALGLLLGPLLLHEPLPDDEDAGASTAEAPADDEATLAPRGVPTPEIRPSEGVGEGGRPEPLTPGSLPAGTHFQQRLALGTELLAIRTRLGTGEVETTAVLPRVRRRTLVGSLDLDAWGDGLYTAGRAGTESEAARILLDWMVVPRRDPRALQLNETERGILRVWTVGERFPPGDVQAGESLLERLRGVAGDRSPYGYDVVATPEMGRELFGKHRMFREGPPAAGLYTVTDDLCLIRTVFGSAYQRVLLKHELVHAWAIRQRGLWASRFLEEGLAEYLSRWLPDDERLDVPPVRFANEFAALLRLTRRLEAYGVGVHSLSIRRLLGMGAQELYGLGRLGYLVAQAAVAYAGADAVEAAVRDGNDWVLRSAVEGLTWSELVAFLEEHARGGRPEEAVVVEDMAPGPTPGHVALLRRVWLARRRLAFQTVGIGVPQGMSDAAIERLLAMPTEVLAQDVDRLRRVLRQLGPGEVVVATEATVAMTGTCRWSEETLTELARLVADPEDIRTRADLVERLVAGLERVHPAPSPVLLHWADEVKEGTLPLPVRNGPARTQDLIRALWFRRETPALLVVCLASPDGEREAVREAIAPSLGARDASDVPAATVSAVLRDALATLAGRTPRPPAAILVVDLGDGESDAAVLASAFAEGFAQEIPVALWNPQRPVR